MDTSQQQPTYDHLALGGTLSHQPEFASRGADRLSLMVNTVLDRLTAVDWPGSATKPRPKPDQTPAA
jgi:hypothetical protein